MQNKIIADLKELGIENIIENEPLYKHTSYKVGGPALVFIEVVNFDQLTKVIDYVLEYKIKYLILGNGSNVLISDKMFQGVVISTKLLNSFEFSGDEVYAMCGVNLIMLALQAANQGLSGLEFASGIPGLVGGSIFMNAGAYNKDMASIVKRVLVYRNKKQEWLDLEEIKYAYRHSIFQTNRDWIILAVDLQLEYSEKAEILEVIQTRRKRRQESQPYDAFSAGSVFKNPSPDVYSWQLIDELGLRGLHINDAQISIKHSNFIINLDRASAQDIYDLIKMIKTKVQETFNIDLKVEQELINFDEEQ